MVSVMIYWMVRMSWMTSLKQWEGCTWRKYHWMMERRRQESGHWQRGSLQSLVSHLSK